MTTEFPFHTIDDAPDAAKPLMQGTQDAIGFVPNLFCALSEAPPALEAYMAITEIYHKTTLTPAEQQLVLLTASIENDCDFCVAAHSMTSKATNVSADIVTALRDDMPVPDLKLAFFTDFVKAVVNKRGLVDDADIQKFMDAGYTKANVLEVILGITLKTLSNYTNHIVKTPLNDELLGEKWSKDQSAA